MVHLCALPLEAAFRRDEKHPVSKLSMKYPAENKSPKILMLLYSLPPMPMGGAEMQGVKLIRHLHQLGVQTNVITWGKLWHRKHDSFNGIKFTRVRSAINIVTDLPSFFINKKESIAPVTKIDYDDNTEITNRMTGKVGLAMILRYQLFYLNCLVYLWLRRKEFDIIHVHMMEWPAFVAVKIGRILKKPVVIKDSTMNGIFNVLRYPHGKNKQQQITHYAHCVAMTKMIRENLLAAGVPAERIFTIPNGIEIDPPQKLKKQWTEKVIFVGNLTQQPAKGIDLLLRAWKIVTERFPKATLQVVGDGDLAAYSKYTSAHGIDASVSFPGRQPNIKQLLLQADIFVLPSRREGMSNALMEAMMCSMPVVATNVSGSQDLIVHEESGLLVPPSNVEELAKSLIQMLSNPEAAEKMGENAYKSVTAKCDINNVAGQYVDMYHQILKEY
jgi:glycosyltransferase involved in cell wall biosynthesis